MAKKPEKNKTRRARKGLDFFLLLTLLGVAAFVFGYLLFTSHEGPEKKPREAMRTAPRPAAKKTRKPPPPSTAPLSRVAIIIDDMGNDMDALNRVIEIGAPIDIAVLPMLRHSKETSVLAVKAGLEVLLHLPMQPKGGSLKGLGPGALLSGMDDKTIRDTLSEGLGSVPGAVGVNNHMGSALTEDKDKMRTVMDALKGRGMFFVDSRTTAGSVAVPAAREAGVRAASRKVFLDDSSDPVEIKAQFDRLVALAMRDGEAIAIGHPHPNTLLFLKQELPSLKEKGVELVLASKLVK